MGKSSRLLEETKKYVTFLSLKSVPQAFTKINFVIGYPIHVGECSLKKLWGTIQLTIIFRRKNVLGNSRQYRGGKLLGNMGKIVKEGVECYNLGNYPNPTGELMGNWENYSQEQVKIKKKV